MKLSPKDWAVIILAAGEGKRMKSSTPKVLHEVGGQPLIFQILNRIQEARAEGARAKGARARVAVVVGHAREAVQQAISDRAKGGAYPDLDLTFIVQSEQRGTGHAARCAMDSDWGEAVVRAKIPVLVLPGDLPLIRTEMLTQLTEPLHKFASMRLLACNLQEPRGYGRIVRRGTRGPVLRIVEERDASEREKGIREVAVSIYVFQPAFLKTGLARLSSKNAQGEYYLTDLVAQAARSKSKKAIDLLSWADSEDLRGINDPWELVQARRLMNERFVRHWALQGVQFIDAQSVWIDSSVRLAPGVIVHQGAILSGQTQVEESVTIGPRVVLKDVRVGKGAHIKCGTYAEASEIGAGAQVGPYAHLRPESVVGNDAKIGNFVELKKARIGAKSSVAHLSYLGDAEVGERVNIGCGFVTCNFDGRVIDGSRKHKTVIEDDVFMGSDCQCVAPVRVGKGSYVASGSTITEDVEPDSLAVARSRQVNKTGYAKKLRGKV